MKTSNAAILALAAVLLVYAIFAGGDVAASHSPSIESPIPWTALPNAHPFAAFAAAAAGLITFVGVRTS